MDPTVGQCIKIGGGYDHEPQWLGGREFVTGIVDSWMPGQNVNAACLVKLDTPLTAEGSVGTQRAVVTGPWLVLETRYVGQTWERSGTVHVELCGERPPPRPWGERSSGAWVESHATYEMLS